MDSQEAKPKEDKVKEVTSAGRVRSVSFPVGNDSKLKHRRSRSKSLISTIKQLQKDKKVSNIKEFIGLKKGDDPVELFQKIDFRSFIGYFVVYILFNFIYWIDMLG